MTFTTDLPVPERALAICAHPDDVEFQAGATLAKWAASGCAIHHVVCTNGDKGSWDPAQDRSRLVADRHSEQRDAARVLGGAGDDVVFLDWPDGQLEAGIQQRAQVAYWIRHFRPEVVIGHDPWKRYRLHPDHRNAGWLAADAVVAARDPHFFPELGAAAWRPRHLLLFEADEANHVESVDEQAAETKVRSLLEHRSQFRSTHAITDADDSEQVARFRQRMMLRLGEHGALAGFERGEAYHLIDRL